MIAREDASEGTSRRSRTQFPSGLRWRLMYCRLRSVWVALPLVEVGKSEGESEGEGEGAGAGN